MTLIYINIVMIIYSLLTNKDRDAKERTLVFVKTKRNADFLATLLSDEGYPTTSIHGTQAICLTLKVSKGRYSHVNFLTLFWGQEHICI